jgi:hypothetical protein
VLASSLFNGIESIEFSIIDSKGMDGRGTALKSVVGLD